LRAVVEMLGRVAVGAAVGVAVATRVEVAAGVAVAVLVGVAVGVRVAVGVAVAVAVGVCVAVGVGVVFGVAVGVAVVTTPLPVRLTCRPSTVRVADWGVVLTGANETATVHELFGRTELQPVTAEKGGFAELVTAGSVRVTELLLMTERF
jgi:hypothetical protein